MSRFAGSIIHESCPDKPGQHSFLTLPKRLLSLLWWGIPEISPTYSIFEDIHGTVEVLKLDLDLVAGKPFDFQIRVSNPARSFWPQHGKIDIHLRWTTPNSDGTDSLLIESWNQRLPYLEPGESHLIPGTSIVPENASGEVFVEFYISSLEGVWRGDPGCETRLPRLVKPSEKLLPFSNPSGEQFPTKPASRAA